MRGRIGEGMPRMANERLPEQSIFIADEFVGGNHSSRIKTCFRTNDTHETGPLSLNSYFPGSIDG